ncbi:MAG: ABC transporter ATP-binding protein [Akkermansiaceae bacterium]|nr:ABC transporter ATP-binding protein [Akkermansiaceae bacterium]
MPLLDIQDLQVSFHTRNGVVKAVDGVSLQVNEGEVVGIVGESGSGKSVTAYSLLGLIPMPPGRIEGGKALFQGTDLLQLSERQLNQYRGRKISMIFQDPMTSLNPYLKVSTQLIEPLEIHEKLGGKKALHRAIEALEQVGIPDAEKRIHSYPHEFSGGMRQRVMIAMALITKPDLLIADEPTTALDVTIQKQVLDVIRDLQRDTGTSVIFITHDLAVVHEMCDSVNVLYAGRVVESAPAKELIQNPLHAYTEGLYHSNPSNTPKGQDLHTIPGLPPDLARLPDGCSFRPRNTLGEPELCVTDHKPELIEHSEGHFVQNCPGCLARPEKADPPSHA